MEMWQKFDLYSEKHLKMSLIAKLSLLFRLSLSLNLMAMSEV